MGSILLSVIMLFLILRLGSISMITMQVELTLLYENTEALLSQHSRRQSNTATQWDMKIVNKYTLATVISLKCMNQTAYQIGDSLLSIKTILLKIWSPSGYSEHGCEEVVPGLHVPITLIPANLT